VKWEDEELRYGVNPKRRRKRYMKGMFEEVSQDESIMAVCGVNMDTWTPNP